MTEVSNDLGQISMLVRLRRVFLPETETATNLLAVSGGIIAVATAYLYFTGFIYSYFFFDRFGVSLESLDLSSQYFIVHSYTTLATPLGMVVGGLLVVFIYICALGKLKRWVLVATLLVTFPILFWLSYWTAVSASQDLRRHPGIAIQLKFKGAETALAQAALTSQAPPIEGQDHLWLLFESKDHVVVFAQPVDAKLPGVLLPADVYTVLRSDLQWSVTVVQ
jgi:hypothetical protein